MYVFQYFISSYCNKALLWFSLFMHLIYFLYIQFVSKFFLYRPTLQHMVKKFASDSANNNFFVIGITLINSQISLKSSAKRQRDRTVYANARKLNPFASHSTKCQFWNMLQPYRWCFIVTCIKAIVDRKLLLILRMLLPVSYPVAVSVNIWQMLQSRHYS